MGSDALERNMVLDMALPASCCIPCPWDSRCKIPASNPSTPNFEAMHRGRCRIRHGAASRCRPPHTGDTRPHQALSKDSDSWRVIQRWGWVERAGGFLWS